MSKITVQTTIKAPIEKVWDYFNGVEHYSGWAFASDTWGAEGLENNLTIGGNLRVNNFAKDGSASFIFGGVYKEIVPKKLIDFDMSDGRNVHVEFSETPEGVVVSETFDAESENPEEMQREGWQAYMDNFKKYVESN